MTRKRVIRTFLWVGVAALSLAPWAIAQNVTLTSAGNNVTDGIYVSPYYATVNGATNTPIVCDDFKDNSFLDTSWTAALPHFQASPRRISQQHGARHWEFQGRPAVVRGSRMAHPDAAPAGFRVPGQVDYSYAVWAVFDPRASRTG